MGKEDAAENSHGGSASDNYDSIFCRAGSSFPNEGQPSSAQNDKLAKPIFLWGIPSTTSDFETGRRELLRKTYLAFYQSIHGKGAEAYHAAKEESKNANATFTIVLDDITLHHKEHTICSLHEWTCNDAIRADCQMIYVFFVGGHDGNNESLESTVGKTKTNVSNSLLVSTQPPPILLNESITDFRDMLLPPKDNSKGFDFHEPGTIYLNIRENQFDGKMTTWFKFASLVTKEYNSYGLTTNTYGNNFYPKIEYIFKVDSDLILFTPHFFRWFEDAHDQQQRKQGIRPKGKRLVRRVYGGIEFPPTNCVVNYTFDHPCPLPLSGPSYMSGELNFVSVDLATYITSDECPREKWTIPHEDVSLSNYIYSYIANHQYHKRREREQDALLGYTDKSHEKDHYIHIVSVDTSNVLLLPNMKASWQKLSVRKNPDVLRSGELLWGHSIRRGNHTQYLYWKKDKKFLGFWNFFARLYITTGNMTAVSKTIHHDREKAPPAGLFGSIHNINKQNHDATTSFGVHRVGKDVGGLLWETKHVQLF